MAGIELTNWSQLAPLGGVDPICPRQDLRHVVLASTLARSGDSELLDASRSNPGVARVAITAVGSGTWPDWSQTARVRIVVK